MRNTQQLNQKQREALENKLRSALHKAEQTLRQKEKSAEATVLGTLIEEARLKELSDSLAVLQFELDDAISLIESKGFAVCDGVVLGISHDAPDVLRNLFRERVRAQVIPETERVQELTKACQDTWSIATLSEAKQLLETLGV
jgi:hypothetical protein